MPYQVIPFNANIAFQEESWSQAAANQLQDLINSQAAAGWKYLRIESLSSTVIIPGTPGSNGCMGLGAVPGTPERRENTRFYVAVFEK